MSQSSQGCEWSRRICEGGH